MFEQFTIEEINLMCIFDTSSLGKLIYELVTAINGFEDAEMTEIADGILKKLTKMSDEEFAAFDFYPVFEEYNGQED